MCLFILHRYLELVQRDNYQQFCYMENTQKHDNFKKFHVQLNARFFHIVNTKGTETEYFC